MLTEYYRRPDLTARAFHDGWYLTGDYGYLDAGEVFVTGRKKDLIIVGGSNIYPQDLEFLADGVPGVHPGRTVAFGIENEAAGTEDVAVLFEAEPGHDPRRVEDAVRQAVASHSDCSARIVRAVPPMWLIKTSSGKISRTRCREKLLQERAGA
jgi:fatty-acyl-CoA synthase